MLCYISTPATFTEDQKASARTIVQWGFYPGGSVSGILLDDGVDLEEVRLRPHVQHVCGRGLVTSRICGYEDDGEITYVQTQSGSMYRLAMKEGGWGRNHP